jgi:tetratricopeptide (TPR) repeat protein
MEAGLESPPHLRVEGAPMGMNTAKSVAALALCASLGVSSTGCIKKMLTDGQIASTRKGSAAVNTLHDFEVASKASFAGLAQFEGMHYLAPDNEDALFLLTKGWAGATFAFTEDEMELAEDEFGDDSWQYQYHRARARAGYDRAIFYGLEMLAKHYEGFEDHRRNDESIRAWLQNFDDPEVDAENLFWVGQAWMAKTNVSKEIPEVVGDLFIGVAMVERSVELDETYNYASGHVILGAYHARTKMAELDESKKHFDRAIELTQGKNLLAPLQYAAKYHCLQGDKDAYVKTLNDVVSAGDTLPEARLQNAIARRRAKRYLSESRMAMCGF